MKIKDLYWLAGIVEGEGCFHMTTGTSGGVRRYPRVQVLMTDEDIVHRCAQVAGVGHVKGPYPSAYPTAKDRWYWQVSKQADAVGLMMTLYPLMGQRRRHKIEEIVAEWRNN